MNEFKGKKFFLDSFGERYKLSNLVKVLDNKQAVLVEIDNNPVVSIMKTEVYMSARSRDMRTQSGYVFKYKHEDNFMEVSVKPDTYNQLKRYLESKTI
jgi:hypothetical protein